MSAPMLTRGILTFAKLRYIHNVFYRSKKKWTGHRIKQKQLIYENIDRTLIKSRSNGDVSSQDSFMPFRKTINHHYLQADRSLLIQLNNQDDMSELLTHIHHKYGTFEKCFCYSVDNGKKLVMIELTNKEKLDHGSSSRVKHLSDLKKVSSLKNLDERKKVIGSNKSLMENFEEYKPKKLQLDMLNHCENVSDQIMCLHKEMQMSEAMVRLHFFVGMLVKRTINKMFKGAQAMFFGSSSCGLAVEGKSDLDMVVLMDGILHPNELLRPLSKELRNSSYLFRNTEHIPNARVPIIKFHQIHTNMSCDLSCNTLTGVLMAEMLHWLNAYEPMFYPLVMTVKIWGKEHHLTSQGMGCHFSNHMLTMLVLAYLQHEELLPALKTLYAKTDKVTRQSGTLSTWRDTDLKKMKRNVHKLFINKDIGSLLQGFFQYYSKFPFHDYIIDVHFGKVIKRPHKYDICVLDPHERGYNVCKNVRALQLDRFQTMCKHSAKLLALYQQKTLDGTPWGLACVLSYDTLKKKKGGRLYDLDIDFSADDGRVQQVAIEVGGDEELDFDVNSDSVNDIKSSREPYLSSFVVENPNPHSSPGDAKNDVGSHPEYMTESPNHFTTFISEFDLDSKGVDQGNRAGDKGKEKLAEDDIMRNDMGTNSRIGATSEKKRRKFFSPKKIKTKKEIPVADRNLENVVESPVQFSAKEQNFQKAINSDTLRTPKLKNKVKSSQQKATREVDVDSSEVDKS